MSGLEEAFRRRREIEERNRGLRQQVEEITSTAIPDEIQKQDDIRQIRDRVVDVHNRFDSMSDSEKKAAIESIASDPRVVELLLKSVPKDSAAFELPAAALESDHVYQDFVANAGNQRWSEMLGRFSEDDILSKYRALSDAKKVMTYLYLEMVRNMPEPKNSDVMSEDLDSALASRQPEPPIDQVQRSVTENPDPHKVDSEVKKALDSFGMSPYRIVPSVSEVDQQIGIHEEK